MFEAIFKLFHYILTTNVKELKYVSLYSTRYLDETENQRIPFPAAFIQIMPFETNSWLQSVQNGVVTVRLHLVTEFYSPMTDDRSIEHLKLLDKVHLVLNNITSLSIPIEIYSNDDISITAVERKGIDITQDFGILKDSTITYQMFMVDKTALPEYVYITISDQDDIIIA